MSEELELLLELQEIDIDLGSQVRGRDRLPGRISALVAEKDRLNADIAAREEEAESGAKERRQMERDLEDRVAHLETLRGKQITIKTNEEYAALQREIEYEKSAISEAEDAMLQLLEAQERVKAGLAEARAAAAEAAVQIDSEVAELTSRLSDLDEAIAVKRDERRRIAMRVDEHLLGRYERLLRSKGDAAIVPVVDGTCSGCRKRLPPQMVIEVRRSSSPLECETCGRLLYWKEGGGVG